MKFVLQKRTYLIIAILLFFAAVSIASTKPEEEEQAINAFTVDYEMSLYSENI